MSKQQPTPEIDRYLSGQLSVEELDQFEQQLAGDSALRGEVEKWKPVYELVRLKARVELKAQLNQLDQEETTVKPLWNRPMVWSIAAAALVLCLVGIWWTNQNERYSPESLVAMNLEPYESPVQLRNDQATPLEEASTAFREERYAEAALGFELMLTDSAQQTEMLEFYAGHSFLLANDPEKAILFLSLVVDGQSLYREPARWYRALAYLKLGLPDASRQDLLRLEHYQTSQAADLLQQLDRLLPDDSQ